MCIKRWGGKSMKKYFACSDIHSFYDEWMASLKEVGFKKNNKDHILIILGDLFDRGDKAWKIYRFITSLPEERVVLIKGNHEYLLLDLVKRGFPYKYDYGNGTYETLIHLYKDPHIVQYNWLVKHLDQYQKENNLNLLSDSERILFRTIKKLYNNKKINTIVEWISSSRWKNYYELGQYIFVHSFIPLKGIETIDDTDNKGTYYPDWRNETNKALWEMATWGCPYKRYLEGSFDNELKKNKVLVCGHWQTSDFYNTLLYKGEKKLDIRTNNPIFMSNKYPGLIALDACTALTHKVNVFVIEEDELEK